MVYLRIRGVITEKGMRARTLTPTDIPGTQSSCSLSRARCGYSPLHLPFLPTPTRCFQKEETNGLKQQAGSRCQPCEKPVVIRQGAGCNQSPSPIPAMGTPARSCSMCSQAPSGRAQHGTQGGCTIWSSTGWSGPWVLADLPQRPKQEPLKDATAAAGTEHVSPPGPWPQLWVPRLHGCQRGVTRSQTKHLHPGQPRHLNHNGSHHRRWCLNSGLPRSARRWPKPDRATAPATSQLPAPPAPSGVPFHLVSPKQQHAPCLSILILLSGT